MIQKEGEVGKTNHFRSFVSERRSQEHSEERFAKKKFTKRNERQRKQKITRKPKRQTTKRMKGTTNQKTPKSQKREKFKNNWRKKKLRKTRFAKCSKR